MHATGLKQPGLYSLQMRITCARTPQPRIVALHVPHLWHISRSGMQILDVVGAYRDVNLPEAVFAAAVPRNYHGNVAALVDEVYSDDASVVRTFDGSRLLVSLCILLTDNVFIN